MSFQLKPMSETYIDKPFTSFPVSEDTFDRMMDVTINLMPLVQQYNTYYASGNLSACNQLLSNNPELQNCLFNAKKYNQLRDAVLAIEEYFLTQIDTLYNTIAQNASDIDDNPSEEKASIVSYSAEKVNQLFNQIKNTQDKYHTTRNILIPSSGWSNTFPYTNIVAVDGITADSNIKVISVYIPEDSTVEQIKSWNKASSFLVNNDNAVNDGSITFKAYKKPTVDFTVTIEGG